MESEADQEKGAIFRADAAGKGREVQGEGTCLVVRGAEWEATLTALL